jgi:hypothetical protein
MFYISFVQIMKIKVSQKLTRFLLTISSANFIKAAAGSAPGDKMKMRGEQHWESLNDPGKSNGGGSMNFLPILCVMNSWAVGKILSGRRHLTTSIRWNSSSLSCHSPGKTSSWGSC